MTLCQAFIAGVKERRKELRMTQAQLAERADLTPTYIAMIESGKRTPSFAIADKIITALNTDPIYIFSKNILAKHIINEIYDNTIIEIKHALDTGMQKLYKATIQDAQP